MSMLNQIVFRWWCQAWGVLSRQWRNRAYALHGGYNSPYPGQPFVHALTVDAWVLSASESPCEFDLRLGDQVVYRGRTSVGVHAEVTSPPFAHSVCCALGPRELGTARSGLLRLSVAKDGASSTIAVTPVRRVQRAKTTTSRSNYGEVWNSVSRNATEARESVAGYADQDEWDRSGKATADYVIRSLAITADDDVLEIGCGTGRIARHMAPRCRHWTGADVSHSMLRFAREELRACANVSLVALNGFDLTGLPDASFDVVYCSAVFMHLDEWDRFRYVKEARRVLRTGGRLFVDNYNLLGQAGWTFFEQNAALDIAVRPPHVSRSSTPQELETYLVRAGFAEIRVEPGDMFVTAIGVKRE